MNITGLVDSRVFSQALSDGPSTQLGGSVHIFRGCVASIEDSSFCGNGRSSAVSAMVARGALYIESPSCALNISRTFFKGNFAPRDGAAMQVMLFATQCAELPFCPNCQH